MIRIPTPVRLSILDVGLIAVLWLTTVVVFYPVAGFSFLHYDDNAYITENPDVVHGLTWQGAGAAFTREHNASWVPLSLLSHMADVELFGFDPGPHHLVNLGLHLMNCALVYWVLAAFTHVRTPSLFVALLFAIHPLHVEPVAWLSSRKDVLSTCFLLLGILAYRWYAAKHSFARYTLVAALFTLALLAKPMAVTFPFVLLLLDYWPLKRMRSVRAFGLRLWEKVPLFLLGGGAAAATVYFTRAGGGIRASGGAWGTRLINALSAYGEYLRQTVWPRDLAIFYPTPAVPPRIEVLVATLLVVTGITVASVLLARRRPYLVVGWFWFIGTLIPVIGLVPIGSHLLADRYTYWPHVGLFLAAVWFVTDIAGFRWRRLACAAGALVLGAYALLSIQQVRRWENDVTVFRHALNVRPPSPMAHTKLGYGLQRQGDMDGAIAQFEAALDLAPDFVYARNNLAAAYAHLGDVEAARAQFAAAIAADPDNARAHVGIGQLRMLEGDMAGAREHFERALAADARDADAHFHYARLIASEDEELARTHYERALALNPRDPMYYTNLGNLYARRGDVPRAVNLYERALELDPTRALVHLNMASALLVGGDRAAAMRHVRQALHMDPNLEPARALLQELEQRPEATPNK